MSLLASLTRSVAEAKDMGSKYSIVQKARSDKLSNFGHGNARPIRGGFGGGGFGGHVEDSPNSNWGSSGEMMTEY